MWVTASENDVFAPDTSHVYDPATNATVSFTALGPEADAINVWAAS